MTRESLLPENIPEASGGAKGSRTWKLDTEKGRLLYEIDGAEAVRQAVEVALSVPRYEHLIFSDSFGHELGSLVGKDPDYIEAAAPGLIGDALLHDGRIEAVEDLKFASDGDAVSIGFTVRTDGTALQVQLKGDN